jgi:hypothetical protein
MYIFSACHRCNKVPEPYLSLPNKPKADWSS